MKTNSTSLAGRVALAALAFVVMIPDASAYSDYSGCAGCHGSFTSGSYSSLKGAAGGTWTNGLHDTHRNTMLSGDCTACHGSGSRTPVLMKSSASAAPFNTSCLGCHGRVEGTAGLTGRGLRAHHERSGAASCFGCHGESTASPVVPENVKPPLYITNASHPNLPKDPCNPSPAFPESFAGTTLGLDNDGNGLYDAADPSCTVTAPVINLNPATLAFGSIDVGTTSPAQTSAIRNTGTAVLTVTGVALCTGTSTEFAFTAPGTPFVVAAGGSANLSVTYAPTAAGGDTGCIAVTSNAASATTNLALSGTGVAAPRIAVAPTTLAFGNVTVGGAPGSLTFQISNTGNATLSGTLARAAGTTTEFTFSPASFTIARGGAAQTVTVTYTPTAVGNDSGSIVVTSNDTTSSPVSVAVSGAGIAAPAPRIAVAPTSLAFGNATVGSAPGSQTFQVSNTGNATLSGTLARATGTSTEFTFSPASFTIPSGGAAQTVTVTYPPTAVGADTGSIVVSSNDATTPTVPVTVTGAGVAAPAPTIALVPSSLSFGNVVVPGSASRTTQVQNNGNAPLIVSAITLGTGTSGEFTSSPAAPITVAAGGSATVTVIYTPTNAGTDSGTIVFASNASTSPTSLSVTGAGVVQAPKIAVAPTALSFGNVTASTTSAAQTFSVSNTGTATLTGTVSRPAGTSAEFAFSPASFSIPAGGAAVTVSVTYSPTTVAADSGNIVVSSNDTTSPSVNVAVSGTGVAAPAPSIALVPNTLAFGNVTLGGSGSATTQVRNTGSATLTVSTIAPCSGTSAEFSFTSPGLPFDVQPGASASVSVAYRPADLGTDSGCLNFSSNDQASSTVSLGLSGTGVAQLVPAIAVSPLSLDFGTVTIGSSTSRTTAIQNTGTGPLRVTGVSLGSGTSAEFSSATATPFSVAAGQSVNLTVTFRPNDASTDTGTVLIASDDPANPSVSVSVSGAGAPPTVGVDIDIVELEVPENLEPRGNTITPTAELKNASTFDGAGSATLVGALGSEEVYRQQVSVSLSAGMSRTFAFPSYTVAPKLKGTINWTLTVQDEDPDVDQATANTSLKKGSENPTGNPNGNPNTGVISADLSAEAPSSGGCSSTGGSVGWLGLVGLGLLGARRRRTVKAPRA